MSAKYNILKALEYGKLSAATKKRFANEQAFADAGWWTQRKYDGVFAKFEMLGSSHGLSGLETRTGEPIESCDHIREQLETYLPRSYRKDGVVLLGELWHESNPFPKTSGDVRRHKPSPHLKFVLNDMTSPFMFSTLPYRERYQAIRDLFPMDECPSVLVAETRFTRCSDVWQYARDLTAYKLTPGGGWYDGAILRDPDACYTVGDAKAGQIIKVKPKLTLDLRVARIKLDKGEKTGRVVYTIEVEYRGKLTTVGAGMPHLAAEVPPQGSIVEIECLGLTADGALREPVYKGIRFDKLEPDT
jgi:ATP-dependent DNA ligase